MPCIPSDPTLNVDLPSTHVKWATAQAASAHEHRDMARHVPHLSLRESPPPRLSFRTARRHTWTNTKEPTSARHARASSCGLLESLHDAGAFAQLKTSDASHRSDAQRPRGYIGPLFMLGRVRGWSPWRIGRCVISYSLPVTTPFSDTGATNRRAWVAEPFAHSAIQSRPWLVAVRAGRTVTVSHGIGIAAVGAASATHLGSACNTGMLISARPSWLPMRSRRSLCFALSGASSSASD